MLSDVGRVRSGNEDCAAYVLPNADDAGDSRCPVMVVADGMGGHVAGEVASRLACETVMRRLGEPDLGPAELLREAIAAANDVILEEARRDPRLEGMGTTLTALLVRDGKAWLGHVGDSRAYLLRDGELHQLSEDHSLVGEMVRSGLLSPEAARSHPEKNVLYKALGTTSDVEPTVWQAGLDLRPGDVLLVCSDGLTDLVPDAAIATSLEQHEPLDACRDLLQQAMEAGGYDNVTVGVFRVAEFEAGRTTPVPTTRTVPAGEPS
jgi:protein phosphatase